MNRTDAENKKDLQKIGKLLGLEMKDKGQNFSGNSATFKINDVQELWVKLYGYRGKGQAQITPISSMRQGSDAPYWDWDKARINIYFAEGKDPEAIAKDIQRRILKSPDREAVEKYTREKIGDFNQGKEDEKILQGALKNIGFDVGEYGTKTTAYYNRDGLYITVRFENGHLYVERFSPNKDNALDVLKAMISAHEATI